MPLAMERLDECLRGRLALIGIGNRWRGDDAAGPSVIEQVAGRVKAICIEAAEAPERHLGEAIQAEPEAILLLDAVDFGGAPGAIAAFSAEDLPQRPGTTHDAPLALVMRFLESETGARVLLIGIQPACTDFGVPLSGPVEASVRLLSCVLTARLGRAQEGEVNPESTLGPSALGPVARGEERSRKHRWT